MAAECYIPAGLKAARGFMFDLRKMALAKIVGACCIILSAVCLVAAEDEIDSMLNVEKSLQKNTSPKKVEIKAEQKTEPAKAVKKETPAPAKPAVVQKTALKDEKKPAVAEKEEKVMHVVAPDNNVEVLRLELRLREIELAKANKEIERLKDIVRRIQEANRRESLIFHYNKASVYRSSMMFKKAEEEYLAALAVDANDAGVHYNLAILYDDNLKDKKKAKQHYEKFLELSPSDPDAGKVRDWLSSIME